MRKVCPNVRQRSEAGKQSKGFQMSLMRSSNLYLRAALFLIKTQLQFVSKVAKRVFMRTSTVFLEADLRSQSLFIKEISQNRRFALDFLTRSWNTPNIKEELNC
jgi:hypothetical protein